MDSPGYEEYVIKNTKPGDNTCAYNGAPFRTPSITVTLYMKKQLLIALSVLLLPACADKEQYQQAVVEQIQKDQQLQKEQHVKDYAMEPGHLAKCVVDTSSKNMPGIFPLDPARLTAYRNYTKMLTLSKSADPKKTLEELRTDFGSAKALAEANANFTESMLDCYAALVSETEEDIKDK